ncbi:helix-turn-helix domain-containing protein [Streptomyces sp. SCL15-4]|uniref:helix-turn-helix domain-containing protein n=1 Tax=Streptomyces sp. SCL15-4 TaxID=2967221 RepID=UPI002967423D|nr:DUF2690 domain-containing protein [Streptomyces sp. SCL15-4]
MPRWTALPDDLDPQITEFTVGLRQLVDRSGLSVAALADRTGYGTTSWERYLDGRLLAPKGAVIALAEATGTQPGPLTTLWELAERAWSRSESRNDSTRQALRMAEGENDRRTTDGDTGKAAGKSAGKTVGKGLGKGAGQGVDKGLGGGAGQGDGKGLGVNAGQGVGKGVGKGSGQGGTGTAVGPGSAGSGEVPPAVPAQPAATDADTGDRAADGSASGSGATTAGRSGAGSASAGDAGTAAGGCEAAAGGAGTPVKNSWGLAGYRGPSQASARPGAGPAGRPAGTPATTPPGPLGNPAGLSRPLGTSAVPPGSHANFLNIPAGTPGTPVGAPGAPGTPAGPGATRLLGTAPGPARTPHGRPAAVEGRSGRWQPVVMFFAGLIGVLALIAGVFYFTHRDGKAGNEAKPSPSASARTTPPPGVKCTGSDCTGKDAEAMGCGGDLVTTAKTATVGTTTLEVRYSKVCGTAWGRITSGVPGDSVRVSVGRERQTGDITAAGDTIGYTPMVAVRNPARARACATLASGQTGCTE